MTAGILLLATALLQAPAGNAVPPPGVLEGRPPAGQTSPIQSLIDHAQPGDRVFVPAGTYEGDVFIDRAIVLVGIGRPTILGSGQGSVVRIRAADVTFEGFDIDGRGGGDLGRDSAGIHVSAPRVIVRDCRVRRSLFGVYLYAADDVTVEDTAILGMPDREPGEVGSGIHVWNSQRFHLARNEITGVRDGMYIQSSSHGTVRGNRAGELRYGLHYMYSDDNVFEDNTFENSAAGAALMYSRRLTFRRNRFVHNRGFASVGLLLKHCDDVIAEDNLIGDNARGVFLDGSYRNQFRGNVIAMSDRALVIYQSSGDNVFEGNAFVGNLSPLALEGKRTDTRFDRNYWSGHGEPDLDGDGIADRPYRLSSVFDHVRGNLMAADLFSHSLAIAALGAAERAFPVLDPIPVVDAHPLARPPVLDAVPTASSTSTSRSAASTGPPLLLLLMGGGLLAAGGRSWAGPGRRHPRSGGQGSTA